VSAFEEALDAARRFGVGPNMRIVAAQIRNELQVLVACAETLAGTYEDSTPSIDARTGHAAAITRITTLLDALSGAK
jgi:hypothetical protein